ncbi:conserved hypothetical protein [Lodderomyces elongisporus NRRL YB-4239]|uniref:Rho-GTPase-activating protein LRG1 n=1 Tax=Lodderomyces elongisporus (strain ATCC 11503 / CBS 2605 / JCM 1781 / NBRC 1676 / NRRL YB-4239) TaxID=379508 RepID=A5DRN1_LODEL|nr:conserved hypothetical protein [Lodderomyces elongisporus NRRL YB-4239]
MEHPGRKQQTQPDRNKEFHLPSRQQDWTLNRTEVVAPEPVLPRTAAATIDSSYSRHSRSRSQNNDLHLSSRQRIFYPQHHDQPSSPSPLLSSPAPLYQRGTFSPIPSAAPPQSPRDIKLKSKPPNPNPNLNSNPNPNQPWTTLIPPLPNRNPKQKDELSVYSSSSQSTKLSRDPSQRHSIAISPTPEARQVPKDKDPVVLPVPRKKSRKVCRKCGLEITGQFVRALQNAFHVQCFTCHECGVQCSAKFFPHEIPANVNGSETAIQVPLCEYDYFKRLDLICFNCDSALRGPYITALGNKYHLEHFKCSVCQHVFDTDESYYEHENNILCHYHYSKLYASHCEGCQSSIIKQFVELFRGGRTQHWHPECFMVHKFWNVNITADSVGLQELYGWSNELLTNLRQVKLSDTSIDSNQLITMEQHIEQVVMSCWLRLSGYEQVTAGCISDMLLNACTANKFSGLVVTGKLMLCVEVLFNALDSVMERCQKAQSYMQAQTPLQASITLLKADTQDSLESSFFQQLRKEPRNITGKIMSYLAILRKSTNISSSGSLSAELLAVITGCAHYLKLLIRIGLKDALLLNKTYGTSEALDEFLNDISQYEEIANVSAENVGDAKHFIESLSVPLGSTDACIKCLKSVEKACIKFQNDRWHLKCFTCYHCHREVSHEASECRRTRDNQILCKNCIDEGIGENVSIKGFSHVSDLSQLVYLLKIALQRSKSVMCIDFDKAAAPLGEEQQARPDIERATYVQTLDDVTRLRSSRLSQKLSKSVKKRARKSVIITAPEANYAQEDIIRTKEDGSPQSSLEIAYSNSKSNLSSHNKNNNNNNNTNFTRKESGASQLSFEGEETFVARKELQIRDEPQRQLTSVQLDRTSDLLKNEKSLTLDDIPRIVAAEQARDQRPNAFKHHNKLYQRSSSHMLKSGGHGSAGGAGASTATTPSSALNHILNTSLQQKEEPSDRQIFYSELSKRNHFIIRHIAIEALCEMNKELVKDDLVAHIQTRKQLTFWEKLRIGGANTKEKTNGVFGIELSVLTKKFGVDSDLGVGPSKLRIPIVIDDVINALKQKDMSVEGIFRLNGNIKKLRELTEQINSNPAKSPDFSNQSAVQLAALMKKWLRELPTPLLTYDLNDLWIMSQSNPTAEGRKRILQLAYCLLPRDHRNLLEVLLYFFSWVASFAEVDEESGSKMDTHNLATVIAPNILFTKQSSNQTEQGDNYFLAIEVVNQLIENHEELSIIPTDILQTFDACGFDANDKLLSSKEIFAQLDSLYKEEKM